MASTKKYLDFVLDQLSGLDEITFRAMMGEYILYYRGKVFGGIYDDRFLVKNIPSTVKLMPDASMELPYDGAKEMVLVDDVDNREFLCKLIEDALQKGEQPSPPPLILKTRIEDYQNGRVFYANEDSGSGITVFYLHGGAYYMDFALVHWKLINILIQETDAQVIAPAYRRLPFATWREAFDFIVPLYREYCHTHPDQKIVLMGDSAGGGLSAALTEQFKEDGIRMPDELILLSHGSIFQWTMTK